MDPLSSRNRRWIGNNGVGKTTLLLALGVAVVTGRPWLGYHIDEARVGQRVLLALTQAGVSREDAYAMVQRNALKVWEERVDFQEQLLADPEVVAALGEDGIREKFDLGYHTKHVDTIVARVFGRDG